MDKRKGEVSRFSFEIFLSHSAEKNRRGTLYGVTDFGYRKILCLKGLCHDFLSNFFVSQYRKALQGNPSVLCFGKFPVANKVMDEKGGNIKIIRRKFFVLTVPNIFVEEPLSISLISGVEG